MLKEPRAARQLRTFALLAISLILLSGCQQRVLKSASAAERSLVGTDVLLLNPDVQLAELTAGGLLEPRADWTSAGEKNVRTALDSLLSTRGVRVSEYRAPDDATRGRKHEQLLKLHQAVGTSIILHGYENPGQLPTKTGPLDWTLGQDVAVLKEDFGAQYGLFIYLHDSYASAGRVAVMFLAAAFGVGIQGGTQVGFASLVDLQSGEVVWFNFLANATGDLRTAEPATAAVKSLLNELPL
ncbi:MAG: hypothetical protein AAF417_16760 [Pseudomonadota bacterium]